MGKLDWKDPEAIGLAVLVFIVLAVLAGLAVKYGAMALDKLASLVGLPAIGSKVKAFVPLAV